MEKFVKNQQYRTFAIIIGAIVVVFVVIMLIREGGKDKSVASGAHYKKEFNTGVDSLTEKELWVEKSTNELDDLKKQNDVLQKQLDSIQKVVIGLGRHLRAFDDQQDDKTDTIPSKEVQDYEKYKNEHAANSPNSSSDVSLNNLENFIEENRGAIAEVSSELGNTVNGSSSMLVVFVSFSMPKASLKELSDQCQKYGATLVIRGLYEGSFTKTKDKILKISKTGLNLDINPELFQRYNIHKVPTFVLVKNGEEVSRLSGNVTLEFVSEKFAENEK